MPVNGVELEKLLRKVLPGVAPVPREMPPKLATVVTGVVNVPKEEVLVGPKDGFVPKVLVAKLSPGAAAAGAVAKAGTFEA